MEVLFFLLPLSVVVTAGAIAAFRWALRNGQMDDLDTPPVRILFDDCDTSPSLTPARSSTSTRPPEESPR